MADADPRLAAVGTGLQTHLFVFHRAPELLDEDVFPRSSPAVHRNYVGLVVFHKLKLADTCCARHRNSPLVTSPSFCYRLHASSIRDQFRRSPDLRRQHGRSTRGLPKAVGGDRNATGHPFPEGMAGLIASSGFVAENPPASDKLTLGGRLLGEQQRREVRGRLLRGVSCSWHPPGYPMQRATLLIWRHVRPSASQTAAAGGAGRNPKGDRAIFLFKKPEYLLGSKLSLSGSLARHEPIAYQAAPQTPQIAGRVRTMWLKTAECGAEAS